MFLNPDSDEVPTKTETLELNGPLGDYIEKFDD